MTEIFVFGVAILYALLKALHRAFTRIERPARCLCVRIERPEECAGVVKVMSGIGLPGDEEPMRMLADGLGYAVAKVEQS